MVDIMKAYDTLDWEFLFDTLLDFQPLWLIEFVVVWIVLSFQFQLTASLVKGGKGKGMLSLLTFLSLLWKFWPSYIFLAFP